MRTHRQLRGWVSLEDEVPNLGYRVNPSEGIHRNTVVIAIGSMIVIGVTSELFSVVTE
jgi:hypothetical protein